MPFLDIEPSVITVESPGHLNFAGVAGSTADAICGFMGFGEEEVTEVNLAVVEAVTNANLHGSQNLPTRRVQTVFKVWLDRLEVVVHDTGPPFDLARLKTDITSTEEDFLDVRGRGMFLMTRCMDSVEFSFEPDGTRCHMVKRLKTPLTMRPK